MERSTVATITYNGTSKRYEVALDGRFDKGFERFADAQSWAYTRALIVRGCCH